MVFILENDGQSDAPRVKAPLTALVVDDCPDFRKLMTLLLRAEGFRVFEAHGGRDALLQYCRRQIDIVVSDIRMPQGDGLTLLRDVRKVRSRKTPVILVSTERTVTLNELPDAFVVKGDAFRPRLLAAIARCIGGGRQGSMEGSKDLGLRT